MPSGPKKRRAAAKKKDHESKIEPNKSPDNCLLTTDFSFSSAGDSGMTDAGNDIVEQFLKENLIESLPLMDVNSSMTEKQTEVVSEDDVSVNEKASEEKLIDCSTVAEESSVVEAFVNCLNEKEDEAAVDDILQGRNVQETLENVENHLKENAGFVADLLRYDYIKEDNDKLDSVEVDLVQKIESFCLKPIDEISDQEKRQSSFSMEQIKDLTSIGIELCVNMTEQIQGLKKKTVEDFDVLLKAIVDSQNVLESIAVIQA